MSSRARRDLAIVVMAAPVGLAAGVALFVFVIRPLVYP